MMAKFISVAVENKNTIGSARGIGISSQEIPEWKKHVIGGKKSSFGMKTNMTLLEQRQSLPIYRLKDELIKVRIHADKFSLSTSST